DVPYVMGVPYVASDIRKTVLSMTVDPVAYSLYALDRQQRRAPDGLADHRAAFNARYLQRAMTLVSGRYNAVLPLTNTELQSITGLSVSDIALADSVIAAQNAPKGMMAMMLAASRRHKQDSSARHPMADMMSMSSSDSLTIPVAKFGPVAKIMQHSKRKMLAKKDPSRMLAVAKKMGASDEQLKKMEAGLKKQMNLVDSSKVGPAPSDAGLQQSRELAEFAHAVDEVRRALDNVHRYRRMLVESPKMEMDALLNGLNGGYIAPSPGGDPIVNPNTLPTGRNLFAINAEETPTADAWEKGVALAKATITDYQQRHGGSYPRKVSYTLWSGEFIQTGGATIAQVLYMLGVEPVRDRYGRVSDLRLIPSEQLGRPRIDVVVQTSGQLRDLAASRLFMISRAVRMAAEASDDQFDNNVRAGVDESERYLIEKGVSPKEAREISRYRVFGGAGGDYGTGIQSMVEQGNAWDNEHQIAEIYLNNMGGFYGDREHWMADMHEAFSAALTRTDVVVQPRQNNTWGALSLDHVYEFMGGLSLAVRHVTGEDPDAVFCDYRNRNHYRMQDSKEAIGVESRTKLFNPSYIKNAMDGGELHTDEIAEMVRNTYGWNVTKPSNISNEMWNEIYDVYVADKFDLGVRKQFAEANPVAMQEMTATMMESARKGFWHATDEQLASVAAVHSDLVQQFGPSGSSFVMANPKLQSFIEQQLPSQQAQAFRRGMSHSLSSSGNSDALLMEKQTSVQGNDEQQSTLGSGLIVVSVVLVLFVVLVFVVRRRRK
ncbi:MAG: cobaltochelatase subunit CobN, partial [Bacteroidales bacterium]|nr:cobaltochelatase subunit CobN [Bacteroidales bacterium]